MCQLRANFRSNLQWQQRHSQAEEEEACSSLQPSASSQVYSHVFGGKSHMGAIDKRATAVAALAPAASASAPACAAVIGNIAPSFAAHKLAAVVTASASITQFKFKCVAL